MLLLFGTVELATNMFAYLLFCRHIVVIIFRLDDFDNSCAAYNKSLELTGADDSDYLTYLNYAITLYNNDELERSREVYERFSTAFGALAESDDIDSEIFSQSMLLKQALAAQQ